MKKVSTRVLLALVGIGCRLPGGCRDTSSFWKMLAEGRSGITEVPADRWCADRFFHPDPAVPGRMTTKRGGFIDHLKDFDPAFWGITPREAIRMDPQQRWLLETSWEAIEDAGVAPSRLRGKNVGVFVGISTHDYGSMLHDDIENYDVHTNSGGTMSIAANRISYQFDLKGPSASVDTACSSALVAVSMACHSIWSGQCEAALAGGVNAIITPHASLGFSKASMLSPTGECFAFDERANGYVRGEGAGVVLLKPLARAIEDGNPIYALIRSAVVNQDGHTSSMTVPGLQGQSEMLRRAYQEANIPPYHVVYIEAHGTGTPVGDPIETTALGHVLSRGRAHGKTCLIGSVKTNIGHLESGSGIAGLIKTALVLDRDMVPPSLNFESPNPNIPFDALQLEVATHLQPLPHLKDITPIASVNSFGFGGTNAHIVMEAAPTRLSHEREKQKVANRSFVLPISARDDVSLREYVKSYRKALEDESIDVSDFCYSAGAHKEHHEHRLVAVGNDARQLRGRLDDWLRGADQIDGVITGRAAPNSRFTVFVFSGQGPQSWAMGRQLLEREPIVRDTIKNIDQEFQQVSGWSIIEELTRPEDKSHIDRTSIAQPAIFALQVALARLWQSWGIEPSRVVGHSVGEIAAAYCAGCYSLHDAVHIIYHRSRLQDTTGGSGRMLVLGVAASHARELIGDLGAHVQITAINSPELITIGGETEPLESIAAKLEAEGRFVRWLRVNYAFHTYKMDAIKDELLDVLSSLQPQPSQIPFISTVTGDVYPGEKLDAMYWWHNVRKPVLFAPAITELLAGPAVRFLELGPHPAMQSSMNACIAQKGAEAAAFHSLARETDESLEMISNLGKLHIDGADIDWAAVNQSAGNVVHQPSYPWHYETYWLDGGEMAKRLEPTLHPLLAKRIATAKPTWQFRLDPRLFPYLDDHRIWDDMVFPAAGYAEIGLAVAHELFPHDSYDVEEVESVKALFTSEETIPIVQVVFDEETKSYNVYSSTSGHDWELNARGRLVSRRSEIEVAGIDLNDVRSILPLQVRHEQLYDDLHALGYGFGPTFSQIQHVWRQDAQALVEISAPQVIADNCDRYYFHPTVLDACFQATFGAWDATRDSSPENFFYLPESVRRIRLHCDTMPARLWAHARQTFNDGKSIVSDILIYDENGHRVADVLGFCLGRVDRQRASDDVTNCLYQFQWEPRRLKGSRLQGSCHFPRTEEIVADVQQKLVGPYKQYQLQAYYHQFVPRLARIACQSVQNACIQLGWDFAVGDRFTSAKFIDKLGIVAEYHQLAHAELHWLDVAGILAANEGEWRVMQDPAEVDVTRELATLANEFPHFASEVALHQATSSHLSSVLSGRVDPLNLLFPGGSNDLLEEFYTNGGDFPAYHFLIQSTVSGLVDSLPPRRAIRVLEIGAGTGSLTRDVLNVLPGARTEYLFTDIGTTFVDAAQTQFSDFRFMDYQTFDVEREPSSQGLSSYGYDLILATNVLHATTDLRQTLTNIEACLAPDGMLMFLEPVTPCARLDNTFGLLKGWWRFNDQDRRNSPLISRNDWQSLLTVCGFENVQSFVCSPNPDEVAQAVMIATASEPFRDARHESDDCSETEQERSLPETKPPPYVVFADEGGVAETLVEKLKLRGEAVVQVHAAKAFRCVNDFEFELVDGSADELREVFSTAGINDVGAKAMVHCWSLDRQEAFSMTSDSLVESQTRGVLSGLTLAQVLVGVEMPTAPRVYFVTRGAQSVTNDDLANGIASSTLVGLCRVANNECEQFRWTVVDLDDQPDEFEIDNLIDEITLTSEENEIAYRNDRRYVNRLRRERLEEIAARKQDAVRDDGSVISFRLQTRGPGTLTNLSLNETPRRTPESHEIEIRVQAGGINFRDVMKALGMYPGNPVDLHWFGDDFAGIVERVGGDVHDLQPGDQVVGLAPYCFRSHVTVDRRMTFKLPAGMNFDEAATLPTVFLTAHYAINHLARMDHGEKILIHAGTGGVGQAAIQIAKHHSVEIFATAGTPEKRQLLEDMGVPHVMDSRTLEFADQIMKITDGSGVDAVLNSLAGEFIPKSLSVLAPFGRFLEIGKIDVYGNSKLGLASLKENISYHVIDLGQVILEKPSRISSFFEELKPRFDSGDYVPLTHKVFPITEVVDAFRYMAQGKHIGKNVLSFSQDAISIGPCTDDGHLFKSDGSYLVTGGAGGFGLEAAKWMARQGTRHLVLMSRSGPNEAAAADIERLRSDGVSVLDVRGDVTKQADVQRVVDQIQSGGPPLKGVVHAAMVLDDESLTQLNVERFNRVLHPKIVGAWNLHTTTLEIPLDHFICFSSISSIFGASKQSNYNAGNCFLNALSQHRRALGMPGLTVCWGAILGAGFVDRNKKTADYLASIGLTTFRADEALRILGDLIQRALPQVAVARVDWQQLRKLSPAIANLPMYSVVAREQSTDKSGISLRRRLSAVPASGQLPIVEEFLVQQIAGVFGIAPEKVERTTSLTDIGLDSLMAVELMNRVESKSGLAIPMGFVLSGPSVEQLAKSVLERLVDSADSSDDTDEVVQANSSMIPLVKADLQLQVFPLTVAQMAILSPGTGKPTVAYAVRMEANVDLSKLREAYECVLNHHPQLRAIIAELDGRWMQRVQSVIDAKIFEYDMTGLDGKQLRWHVARQIQQPFDLESTLLTRLDLYRCGENPDIAVLTCHAVIADAWSTKVACCDLLDAYHARCAEQVPDAKIQEFSYQDFAAWQKTILASETGEKATSFWVERLTGAPSELDLPTDRARNDEESNRTASAKFELDNELTLRLRALSAEYEVSIQDTLYAAFAMLVHQWSQQEDMLLGYRFDGRVHAELRHVVGPFENWMPLRSRIDFNATFRDFLATTGQCLLASRANQHIPLTHLLDQLDMQRDPSREPLVQVAFVSEVPSDFEIGRQCRVPSQFDCDVTLEVQQSTDGVLGWWHYNEELFESATFERLNGEFMQLLESILQNPSRSIVELCPQIADRVKLISPEQDIRRVKSRTKAGVIDFEQESLLDAEITPISNTPVKVSETPRLFLTGSTGFIGAYLLAELLERTGSNITCLVRAKDERDGLRRIRANLAAYDLSAPNFEQRVSVVIGDFSKPLFGLEQDDFHRLADEVDVLYHNGADTNLALSYSALRTSNVIGTREMLRLACLGHTKPVHMTSTFTVHTTDANRGQVVSETDPLPDCEDLLYGYSQSKWVAEKMILAARDRGVPVAIYRPGHVIGDSKTGASNTADLLYTLVLTCVQLGAAPSREVELDMTPVDYVAAAIAALSLREDSLNQTFHLTNPHPMSMKAMAIWIRQQQLDIEFLPDDLWRNRLLALAEQIPLRTEEIRVLADVLVPRALAAEDAYAVHPRFDSERAQRSLAQLGIQCAPADERLLETCLEYLLRTGAISIATELGE